MTQLYTALVWLGTNGWWIILAFTCGYGVAYAELSREIAELHASLAEAESHES